MDLSHICHMAENTAKSTGRWSLEAVHPVIIIILFSTLSLAKYSEGDHFKWKSVWWIQRCIKKFDTLCLKRTLKCMIEELLTTREINDTIKFPL